MRTTRDCAVWKAKTERVFFFYDCIVLITILNNLYIAWVGQKEAHEKWELMKLMQFCCLF
jgi:hypothetical protein